MLKFSDLVEKISEDMMVDKEIYEELLTNPHVMKVMKEHESVIHLATIPSTLSDMHAYVKSVDKCEGCEGLDHCRQVISGHKPTLMPQNGRLQLTYEPCAFYKAGQHLRLLENFHMPKAMMNASYDNMYPDVNREQIFALGMDFILNYKPGQYKKGMYIHGSMGSGKTYALCAIANELAKRGIGSAVVYFPELIANIKEGFNQEGSNERVLDRLKEIPVLMLDDIGSENVTSWMRDEVLGRLVNYRMMHQLPTFFTSNFDFAQLEIHYGQTTRNEYEPVKAARIIERIKALATPVELVGRNYRNEG